MTTHRNHGFSAIEMIIVMAILSAIGFAGWYAYGKSHSANGNAVQTATTVSGVALGLDTPISNETKAIALIGKTPAIIDGFYQWQDNNGGDVSFPTSWVNGIVQLHSMPMITWEPSAGTNSVGSSKDQPNFNLSTILSGKYDTYIKAWALAAKQVNHPVYVRLMHEMNDPGYAWGAGVNGNTPSQYVSSFQHIVSIFQQNNATNVQLIWCIGANKLSPNPSVYFPGDKYVSWISIDGYNRNKPWSTFADIFTSPYKDITAISSRPVLIAETASVEDPSNPAAKPDWITTTYSQTIPKDFPRIKAINYFNSAGNNKGLESTYPINSSVATLAAIKQVFASSNYQATAPSATLSY
jgi:prepilin-type N-terminal cleavage/methylation domain-containing protein